MVLLSKQEYMKRQITITYNFWDNELPKGEEIPAEAQKALEEAGKNRVLELIKDRWTSGELNEMHNGKEYRGWWEIKIQTL